MAEGGPLGGTGRGGGGRETRNDLRVKTLFQLRRNPQPYRSGL